MERSGGEDPKLSEVKAVLQRLQRISADQEADTVPAPLAVPHAPAWLPLVISFGVACAVVVTVGTLILTDFTRLTFAFVSQKPAEPGKAKMEAASAKDTAPAPSAVPKPVEPGKSKADIAVAKDVTPAPPAPPAAAPPLVSKRPALDRALGQLGAGQVQAARRQLLALARDDAAEAEVAWALARSYDPNFLSTISGADAVPNIPEATRWYRAWHAAAIRDGLVTHGLQLERIIDSMR